MNPVCSLSDSFRGARSVLPSLSVVLCLLGVTRAASAQAAGAPATTQEAPPPAEAPAAPEPPTPTAPVAPAPSASEPVDAEPEEHKKHKKHKHAANADEPATTTEGPDLGPADPEAKDRADKPAKAKHDIQLKGRLFALAEVSHRHETVVGSAGALQARDRDALDLSLQSARFGVAYHSPLRFLSAQLELEIAGKPRVKDAFLEAGKTFFVKVGQFKVPSATFELESPWTLPLARRGLVHDLMTDWLDIAGRRPGVAFGYKGKGGVKPRLTLGAFQGTTLKQVVPGDRDVRLIDHASLTAQTYAARGEVTLAGVTLGAWYEQRVGSTVAAEFSHFATFGVDAEVSQRFEHGALRAWVDGSAGESLYVTANKPGTATPWFASGRALVSYRFGGLEQGEPYVEPFGFFALMDPDTEVVSDFVSEAAVGVAAGFWDRARLTLQGEMIDSQRNFPGGFLDSQNPDHMSLLLQAGARF